MRLLRLSGLLIGFGSILTWIFAGHPPNSGVMTFAAGLVAAPDVQSLQRERNARREKQAES